METYLGQSEWKKRAPKVRTNWTVLLTLIFTVLWVLLFFYTSLWADQVYASCPEVDIEGRECGMIIKEPYYAEYPEGSWERINAFCNQMLDTNWECN